MAIRHTRQRGAAVEGSQVREIHEASIARERLLERIGVPPRRAITIILAPAGYGKSTLVRQWARRVPHPVAWISLSTASNTVARLDLAIATALAAAVDDVDTAGEVTTDQLLAVLRATAEKHGKLSLVFDDYQTIGNLDVHDEMNTLLANLPPDVSVILLSREDLPLSLGALRAEGRIQHLTDTELAFLPGEVAQVVAEAAPGFLSDAQVAELARRTEGWIAGIRLALLTLEHVSPESVDSLVDTWSARRWLDDYVVGEVLSSLPADLRRFVERTAILTDMTPGLCDAVLEEGRSAEKLRLLSERLVFVHAFDGREGSESTWSYHALFAESVRRIAQRSEEPEDNVRRHARAADWLMAKGQHERAIEHAIAAEDWDLARKGLRIFLEPLFRSGYHQTWLYWLEKLPEAEICVDLELSSWYILALQYGGEVTKASELFPVLEPRWRASGNPMLLGTADACRGFFEAFTGDRQRLQQLCFQALSHYPATAHYDRLRIWTTIMEMEFMRGHDDLVREAYVQARHAREHLPARQRWWTIQTEPIRINHYTLRGDLGIAEELYREAIEHLPINERFQEAKIRFRLAAIYLEWNDLERAGHEADTLDRDLARQPFVIWHPDVLLVIARIREALGDVERMDATLGQLRSEIDRHGGIHHRIRAEALEAQLWLRTGRHGLARDWVRWAEIDDRTGVLIFGDPDPRQIRAEIALAEGRVSDALGHLEIAIASAIAAKRWAELIPLAVWQAVALAAAGNDDDAVESLKLALRHAVAGGFIRSFLTPGHDIAPLLRRASADLTVEEARHAHRILEFLLPANPRAEEKGRALPPAPELSARERQVLTLLQMGMTNHQIGVHLFVSDSTAKKHVGNVLAKLGVPNRTAAVRRAIQLGLLPHEHRAARRTSS